MVTKLKKKFFPYIIFILCFLGIVILCIYTQQTPKNNLMSICKSINNEHLDTTFQQVYVIPNVFSLEECNYIIKCSEEYASKNGWKKDRHKYYPTTDNDIKNISDISYLIENRVYSKLVPEFGNLFNIPNDILGIDETFVVKYTIGGQKYLEPHQDGDDFSFVIKLNDDFKGGGTYFLNLKKKINCSLGSAVIFCGKNRHMGLEITSGTRYILAGFLSLKKQGFCEENI
jgi:hypothetical protein